MVFLFAISTALCVTLLAMGAVSITSGQSRVVKRRLAALRGSDLSYRELQERRRREAKLERLQTLLETIGERVGSEDNRTGRTRDMLVQAGYRGSRAPAVYIGSRIVLAGAFWGLSMLGLGFFGLPATDTLLASLIGAGLGYYMPFLYIRRKVKSRQQELMKTLPDMLDLLVVCVESGLGLNQALVRVSEEIDHISPAMSDELTVVNLEIRAGKPRHEALRNLGERTGLSDVRALISMLVQTDRFGTSVADALRTHSDTLRTIRMQRAEERAAKVPAKLVFPLVLFVFPAFGVVILGPGVIQLMDVFSTYF